MQEKEVECEYCNDTGYIGSRLEIGHYPCTDCKIWEQKLEASRKVVQQKEGPK